MEGTSNETPLFDFEGETEKTVEDLTRQMVETGAALEKLIGDTTAPVIDPATGAQVLLPTAQWSLQESYRLLEQIFDTTDISIVYMDRDLNIVRVNRAFAQAAGQPPAFFIGRNYGKMYLSPKGEKIFREVVASGEAFEEGHDAYADPEHPERGVTYWRWTLRPVKNQGGNIQGVLLTSRDVTELQQTRLVLEENQRMFEHFFNASPDANIVVNAQGKIVHTNRQVEFVFGYERDELIGEKIEVLIPERFGRSHKRLRSSYHKEPIMRPMGIGLNLFGRRKNGSEFPVDVTLSPMVLNGETHVIAVVRDITRRVESEEAARRQAEYIKLLQDVAVSANESHSIDEALQYAMDRICQGLKWPVGHAILAGKGDYLRSARLWHLDDPQLMARFRKASEEQDHSAGGLPSVVYRTGQPAWFEDLAHTPEFRRAQYAEEVGLVAAFSFPILVGSEVVGVLEFFDHRYAALDRSLLDVMANIGTQLGRVVERERSREALQRSEARFRAIFEKSAIGIQLIDAEGNILETNPALQKMLGYTAAELQHLALTEISHPHDLEQNWKLLKDLLRGESSNYQTETRYVHKNGELVWTELSVSAVKDSKGGTQMVIVLVRNITDLKRKSAELDEVQRKLLESTEMERLSLARELHDGPLQDLYGATFALQNYMSELTSPGDVHELEDASGIVQNVIGRLRNICGDLRPPALYPFGLEKAIRSHVERIELLHPQLNIHLELMSDRRAFTEQARLALFRNYQQLVANVVRHAQASNLWIRLSLDENWVTLEVEDDGRGFALPDRWVDLAREGHAGLLGVLERTEAFGGTMDVLNKTPHGVLVRVRVPRERINLQSSRD